MRHVYECPMRWADLDLLGHVNNVVYVDYLQEARVDMLLTHAPDARSEDLAEGVVVVRHEVEYAVPLLFDRRSVQIESWVTEVRAASFTMAYEVFHETGEPGAGTSPGQPGRQVYARAATVLTPYVFSSSRPRRITPTERDALHRFLEPADPRPLLPALTPPRVEEHRYPVHVRFSDVDAYGHVNNVKYLEYLQEARILLLEHVQAQLPAGAGRLQVVVARTDVDYRVPILFRPEPYDAWSVVSHVGRSSVVVETEICDADTVLARARVVLVLIDPATGRSAPLPEPVRSAMTG